MLRFKRVDLLPENQKRNLEKNMLVSLGMSVPIET